MKPIEKPLLQLGNSAAVTIPAAFVEMFDFKPGDLLRIRLTEDADALSVVARRWATNSLCVVVPKEHLDALGLAVGDRVKVPFFEWRLVEPAKGKKAMRPKGDTGDATGAQRATPGKPSHSSKRDKKSPRSSGVKPKRGEGEEGHGPAYAGGLIASMELDVEPRVLLLA